MHKNTQRHNVDLHHLEQQRLYQGIAVIDKQFAQDHINAIAHLHLWDYGFWLEYLDLQRQALGLTPKFVDLDETADQQEYKITIKTLKTTPEKDHVAKLEQIAGKSYQPVINEIIKFWQKQPITIYGSVVFLHGMAKTFFRNKISYEEPAQGHQIKQAINDLKEHKWDKLQQDLYYYKGWWN